MNWKILCFRAQRGATHLNMKTYNSNRGKIPLYSTEHFIVLTGSHLPLDTLRYPLPVAISGHVTARRVEDFCGTSPHRIGTRPI